MEAIVGVACAFGGLVIGLAIGYFMLRQHIASETLHQRELRLERESDFSRQMKAMEDKFQTLSEKMLQERSREFKNTNREQMDAISKPLLMEIENMRKQMGLNKEGSDKSLAELNGTIKTLLEKSAELGRNAENLTNALKNRGKVQGDWGEQVLSNILADSDLREGEEFFTQKSFTGTDGKEYRPDVVVKCANDSFIILDSKVSLTAYTDYLSAESDESRDAFAKANLDSVWNHVMELACKDYPNKVPGSMKYVLMFVPNEGSYILAMNRDPQIGLKAFKKGVIIINPTNLMLALSLIRLTWQNTRQEENCAKVMKAATSLYDKFCTFSETFVEIGEKMDKASASYHKAKAQLNEGRGNIVSQFEGMQKLGIATAKRISEKLSENLTE